MQMMVELASSVPSAAQTRGEQAVSGLPPLGHLVLKIVVLLGGFAETALIRHLLNEVSFVEKHYNRLCHAFRQTHAELCSEAREEARTGRWLIGIRNAGRAVRDVARAGVMREEVRQDIDVLLVVFQNLKARALINMDGEGIHVWCEDLLLVDQLYQGLSFAHRKELHTEAARWMLDTHDKEERKQYLPHIIHHTMMSQHESRVPSLLKKAQNLERSSTLQDQISHYVSWYLDTKSMDYPRAQMCMRAIPFLRGLAKALDQQRVTEKVSTFGARLSTTLAAQRKRQVSYADPELLASEADPDASEAQPEATAQVAPAIEAQPEATAQRISIVVTPPTDPPERDPGVHVANHKPPLPGPAPKKEHPPLPSK